MTEMVHSDIALNGASRTSFPSLEAIHAFRLARLITQTDRLLAALAAAYISYRLWSGMKIGVVYGDGDNDVHANTHPTAYLLTVFSCLLVIAILGYIAIGPEEFVKVMGWFP